MAQQTINNGEAGSSVRSKLNNMFTETYASEINVKNFGAVGDGTTDDRAAIQAALNAVPSYGGRVFFPPVAAFYKVTNSLNVKAGTHLYGVGYNSVISCPAVGWTLVPQTGYGILNLYLVDNVTIEGIRLSGTTQADIGHTPKLLYIQQCNYLTIQNCFFENTAYEGFWQGGAVATNNHINVLNNTFTNCGQPNEYVGLPAIQFNATRGVIRGNHLTGSGTAIALSGNKIIVSDNIINGITLGGIGTGDNIDSTGFVITNNQIEFVSSPTQARRGIILGAGSGALDTILVTGNHIRMSAVAGDLMPKGIVNGGQFRALIEGNIMEITGFGTGIELSGYGNTGPTEFSIIGNVVRAITEIQDCYAFRGIAGGAGFNMSIISSNNCVRGTTRAKSSFAYDFNANGGGAIVCVMMSDYKDDGLVRIGTQFYNDAATDKIALNLHS